MVIMQQAGLGNNSGRRALNDGLLTAVQSNMAREFAYYYWYSTRRAVGLGERALSSRKAKWEREGKAREGGGTGNGVRHGMDILLCTT